MRRNRFTENHMGFALRQRESGTPAKEICQKLGAGKATFYRWKKKYRGLDMAEVRRWKQFRDKNGKLNRLVAGRSKTCRDLCES